MADTAKPSFPFQQCLPRKLASEANPLISEGYTEDTMGRVADVIDCLATLFSGFNGNTTSYYCSELLFDMVAAALRYEIQNSRLQMELCGCRKNSD